MKAQHLNKIVSSTFLWLEHEILKKGSGYYPVNTTFYDVFDNYSDRFAHGSQFGNIVADSSLPGAVVTTGVYIDSVFSTTGQNTLTGIDYNGGRIYLDTQPTGTITGQIYTKEFEFALTNKGDETILFETKHYHKPKIGQIPTGLAPNEDLFPIIYLRYDGSENVPAALGGTDDSQYNFRGVVLTDNLFSLDAVLSIITDTARKNVPLLEPNEFPYDAFGGLRSGVYDYEAMTTGKPPDVFVERAYVTRFQQFPASDVNKVPIDMHIGFFDLHLSQYRTPRA